MVDISTGILNGINGLFEDFVERFLIESPQSHQFRSFRALSMVSSLIFGSILSMSELAFVSSSM